MQQNPLFPPVEINFSQQWEKLNDKETETK